MKRNSLVLTTIALVNVLQNDKAKAKEFDDVIKVGELLNGDENDSFEIEDSMPAKRPYWSSEVTSLEDHYCIFSYQSCGQTEYFDTLACQCFSRAICSMGCTQGLINDPRDCYRCINLTEYFDLYPTWITG